MATTSCQRRYCPHRSIRWRFSWPPLRCSDTTFDLWQMRPDTRRSIFFVATVSFAIIAPLLLSLPIVGTEPVQGVAGTPFAGIVHALPGSTTAKVLGPIQFAYRLVNIVNLAAILAVLGMSLSPIADEGAIGRNGIRSAPRGATCWSLRRQCPLPRLAARCSTCTWSSPCCRGSANRFDSALDRRHSWVDRLRKRSTPTVWRCAWSTSIPTSRLRHRTIRNAGNLPALRRKRRLRRTGHDSDDGRPFGRPGGRPMLRDSVQSRPTW